MTLNQIQDVREMVQRARLELETVSERLINIEREIEAKDTEIVAPVEVVQEQQLPA